MVEGVGAVNKTIRKYHWLFLSSANMTQQAFTINMKLGLLETGWKSYQTKWSDILND
jgi:hypothetical protein